MRTLQQLLILILLFFLTGLRGQNSLPEAVREQYELFDNLYGLDPNLINGIRYRIEFPDIKGHPFLDEEHFSPGSIQIGELWYRDVTLAYNIYNQEVVLKYINTFGGSEYVVLHNEFIDGFLLGPRKFVKLDLPLTGEHYFQVIDAGELKCYYRWTKSINESVYPYSFWEPSRKFYLFRDDRVHAFNSKATFLKSFEKKERKSIRNHLRKERIRLKLISDERMMELLQYCAELNEK